MLSHFLTEKLCWDVRALSTENIQTFWFHIFWTLMVPLIWLGPLEMFLWQHFSCSSSQRPWRLLTLSYFKVLSPRVSSCVRKHREEKWQSLCFFMGRNHPCKLNEELKGVWRIVCSSPVKRVFFFMSLEVKAPIQAFPLWIRICTLFIKEN